MNPLEHIEKIQQVTDINEKIRLRTEFKEKYPNEFEEYMKAIPKQKQRPPLCYGCKHFIKSGDCELNLFPIGNVFKDVINYTCPSFEKK
ncbi:MAG: hypothetical protein Q7S45_01850 [Candidatus Curtissbacteria bacterium]|nr:hypothetical protein [Candidatus Curtissbacteria bacterium]